MGHWRRDCPVCKAKGQEGQTEQKAGVQTVLAVNSSMSPTRVHVTAEINGEPVSCLLDSGCEHSVINAALVPNVELSPSEYTLYAANRASLDVIGDCVISFAIDGHSFEADVSVLHKVDEFLLGGDWLEKNGANWDFSEGTVTLGGGKIQAHRRRREGICRRIVVAQDCVVPARHEANIAVRMEADNIHLPPSDWVVEPKGLGPGVMTARTPFSNRQSQLVARVLNNSHKPMSFRANSLLSTAEPAECISGSGSADLSDVLCVDSSKSVGCVTPDESVVLVSDSLRSPPTSTEETGLRAATVCLMTAADRTDSDSSASLPENAHDHIESLLRGLPPDLTDEQRDRAEAFIRSRANVFSRSEYNIGHTSIIPHRIDTGEHAPHFEQLRRHPQAQLPVIDEHVQNMLEHDVIEPAASPWCSNVVMVHKQDGMCDFA